MNAHDPRSDPIHGGWRGFETSDGTGVLAIPEDGGYRAILERPRVRRRESGRPSFSATLELERQPAPDEESLAPLVRGALVMLELQSVPREEELRALSSLHGQEFRALFPRESAWRLRSNAHEEPLATLSLSGFSTSAALEARLDTEAARAFLSAVAGEASGLSVEVRLGYRWQGSAVPASSFSMDLQAVHDRLSDGAGPEGFLWERDLVNYLADMLRSGLVTAEPAPPADAHLSTARAALVTFLRAARLILRQSEDGHDPDLGPRYELQDRPGGPMTFRFRMSGGAGELGHRTISAALSDVLREALAGQSLDSHLHLVGASGGAGRWREIPRLLKGIPGSGARSGTNRLALAAIGANLVDVGTAVRPSTHVAAPAHHMMTAEAIRPEIAHWPTAGVALEGAEEPVRSLPVVEKEDAALWRDRRHDDRFWYAPEWRLVVPAETDTPEESPFLFTFRATGHDLAGTAGIEATVRFDLVQQMSQETRAAWERREQPRTTAVPTDNLSVELHVPVRLSGGAVRTERFPADSVERTGERIRATFSLLDDWARATYGALALEGYQSEPARVSVAYTFPCYRPVGGRKPALDFGGKRVGIPVGRTRSELNALEGRVHFDVAKKAVRFGSAEVKLKKERFRRGRAERGPASAASAMVATPVASPVTAVGTAVSTAVRPGASVLPHIRPQLIGQQAILEAVQAKRYALGRRGETARPEAFLACARFGALYVQREEATTRAVGCLAPTDLGRPDPNHYRLLEVPEADDAYFVYRSLRTPGRFLVVPATYRIGRFEPEEGDRAYRPTVLLYSAIDVEDLEKSRCVITATLIADVAAWQERELLAILRERHDADPTLEWPTVVSGDVTFTWALPTSGAAGPLQVEVEAVREVGGFRVSLTTNALGVPVLQEILSTSGVHGSVRIRLADGSTIESSLALELGHVIGPGSAGPVSVTRESGGVRLRNHTEAPADVSDLLVVSGGELRRIPVEEHLPAGESVRVDLSPVPTETIDPVYSLRRTEAGLEEIRSYIEDVSVSALFINLLDMEGRGLVSLEIRARVRGLEDERSAVLAGESEVAEMEFLLPLTRYLEDPVLEFTVRRTSGDGGTVESPWREWRLTEGGSVIALTWDRVS